MTVKEWTDIMAKRGMICREGVSKLSYCKGREDVFRVLCDAFAVDFLPQLMANGEKLPLDGFRREYADFLDGRFVCEYPRGYTSKMYCGYGGLVEADTTLVSLIGCDCAVVVPENRFPRVVLSPGCRVSVSMMSGSRLALDVWGGSEYTVSGDMGRVRITKH